MSVFVKGTIWCSMKTALGIEIFPKFSQSILDPPSHYFSTSSPLPWFTAEYTCLGGWIITACTNSYFHQLGERRVLDFTFIGQMHFPLIEINVLSHWQNCGDILSLHDPFTKGANDKRCQHPKLNIFDPFTKGGGVTRTLAGNHTSTGSLACIIICCIIINSMP